MTKPNFVDKTIWTGDNLDILRGEWTYPEALSEAVRELGARAGSPG